jgi:hypothetical protein
LYGNLKDRAILELFNETFLIASSGPGYGLVAGPVEHGNVASGSIKSGEFLD